MGAEPAPADGEPGTGGSRPLVQTGAPEPFGPAVGPPLGLPPPVPAPKVNGVGAARSGTGAAARRQEDALSRRVLAEV